MPRPRDEARARAAAWRFVVPATVRGGLAGERLGRGSGASLEFEDRRVYVPGDDVRHIDWPAYARTDQLQVRVYREEIVPRLELVVDGSASMAVDETKAHHLVDLAAFLVEAARNASLDVRVVAVRDRPELLEPARFLADGVTCDGRGSLLQLLPAVIGMLRPRALVCVISDFLFPHAAPELVRPLLARAGPLTLLQLLGAEDLLPPPGAARLTDAEDNSTLEVVLDAPTVARYAERRQRLSEGLAHECRRGGATFVELAIGPRGPREPDALPAWCRNELAPRRVIAPKG